MPIAAINRHAQSPKSGKTRPAKVKRHRLATRSSPVPARTGLANLRCHFLTFRQVLAAVQKLTLPVKQHLVGTINGSLRVTGLLGLEADSHQVCG